MDKRLLLLGLLRQHRMHGYELAAFIDGQMNTCTDMKKATAYFLLDKMTGEGWVTNTTEREGNRPERRVFTLTEKGEEAYQRLVRENLREYDPAIFTSDVGVAFLDDLEPSEARALLSERRKELTARLERASAAPRHTGSVQLLVDHQIHHLQSEIVWLDAVLGKLA